MGFIHKLALVPVFAWMFNERIIREARLQAIEAAALNWDRIEVQRPDNFWEGYRPDLIFDAPHGELWVAFTQELTSADVESFAVNKAPRRMLLMVVTAKPLTREVREAARYHKASFSQESNHKRVIERIHREVANLASK